MYGSNTPSAAKCVSGGYDDVDDLAITVKPNPALQGTAAAAAAAVPGKNDDVQGTIIDEHRGDADIEADRKKKELMDMNQSNTKPKVRYGKGQRRHRRYSSENIFE